MVGDILLILIVMLLCLMNGLIFLFAFCQTTRNDNLIKEIHEILDRLEAK